MAQFAVSKIEVNQLINNCKTKKKEREKKKKDRLLHLHSIKMT